MPTRKFIARRIAFDTKRFVKDLKIVAKERGMTFTSLAREIGVHDSTLSYMNTIGSVPDGTSLAALAKWSGLNVADYSVDLEQQRCA